MSIRITCFMILVTSAWFFSDHLTGMPMTSPPDGARSSGLLNTGSAIPAAEEKPELFFREDWREIPAEMPASQNHVANPNLLVQLYGPGLHGIKKSNHPSIPNDPYYIWSGACPGNWAVSLKHRSMDADLSNSGTIRWRSKQAGFRQLHIILRLSNGIWLVSDKFDDASTDWRIKEFSIKEIHWRSLDIARITEGKTVDSPDLTRVEEIGFSDLMPGGLSDACSRLDWIEVYGKPIARPGLEHGR
jgi:hypothetical protein